MKFTLIVVALLIFTFSSAAQTAPALREELLKMRELDQQARRACAKGSADEQA